MTTLQFTVHVTDDVEDLDDPQYLLDQIAGQRAVVDVEGYRFYGTVQPSDALADLARAYEEQRRPGSNHLMTEPLARAIEQVLA